MRIDTWQISSTFVAVLMDFVIYRVVESRIFCVDCINYMTVSCLRVFLAPFFVFRNE